MTNDLLISIGADLSSYTATLDKAQKQFTDMQKSIAGKKNAFASMGGQFTKVVLKMEKEAREAGKVIRKEVAQSLNIKDTGKNKAIITRYVKLWTDANTAIENDRLAREAKVKSQRKKIQRELYDLGIKYDKNLSNAQLKRIIRVTTREREAARKAFEVRMRLARLYSAAQARLAKARADKEIAETKRVAKAAERAATRRARASSATNPWGNIESVKHAIKTTALYGATAQALFGIQNAMRSVVTESIRFNQSIADIGAVLQYTRGESFKVASEITRLSVRYGEAVEGIQEATLTLGRAGVEDINELISAMKNLTALSIITGDSVSDGANAIASLISVFGNEGLTQIIDETGEAIDKYGNKTEELSNHMAAVANATRLGLADFSTISNYALTSAKTIGLTSEAYFALAGAMSKVGLNASTIGTSIRRLGKLVTDTSDSVQGFFVGIGYSQEQFAEAMLENSVGAIQILSEKMAELNSIDLAEIMPNQVQMRATLNTLKQIYDTQGIEAMQKAMTDYGFVTEQADKAAVGLGRALTSIGNAVKEMYNNEVDKIFYRMFNDVSIEEFNEQMHSVIENIKSVLYWVWEAVKAFLAFKAAVAITNGVIALTGAIRGLVLVFQLISIHGIQAATGVTLLSKSLKVLAKGAVIGLIVAAFEAWNWITNKQTDDLNALYDATHKTVEEMEAMNVVTAEAERLRLDKVVTQRKELFTQTKKELQLALKNVEITKNGSDLAKKQANEALILAKEKFVKEQGVLHELKKQRVTLTDIIEGTKEAAEGTEDVSQAAIDAKENLAKAVIEAYKLATALREAADAFQTAQDSFAVASGTMSGYTAEQNRLNREQNTLLDERDKKLKALNQAHKTITDFDFENDDVDYEGKTYINLTKEWTKAKTDLLEVDTKATKLAEERLGVEYKEGVRLIQNEKTLRDAKILTDVTQSNINDSTLISKRIAAENHASTIKQLEDTLAITKNTDDRTAIRATIIKKETEYQLALKKEIIATNKASAKGAKDAQKQQKINDKAAKDAQKVNQENAKQDILRYQIGLEKGKDLFLLESKSLKEFKYRAKVAKELVAKNKLLIKGTRSRVENEKDETNALEAELELLEAMTAEMNKWQGIFDSLFEGDFEGIINGIFSDTFESLQKKVAELAGGADSLVGSIAGGFTGAAIGLGIQAIGELLSTTVSQEEIDAATGRTEYSDESLKNLADVFESAQYPMLEVTNKMYRSIKSMDDNFSSIARAFSTQAATGGIDLTGANFVDTLDSGFLGFSSKSIELIGTGLIFTAQNLGDMMELAVGDVLQYTTTLEKKSKAWGLITSEKIKEVYGNLPQPIIDDLAENFSSAYNLLLSAGVSLGFDENSLAQQLSAASVDLGKIDFTGLSPDEISQRLSDVFSTGMSGVVDQIPIFTDLLDRYAKGTEQALETLGRLAVEYDQASYTFGLIGKSFANVDTSYIKTSVETIPIIGSIFIDSYEEAAQALTDAGFAVNYENILKVWGLTVTGVIGYTTETVNTMVTDVYSAQQQILDIVDSAGGIEPFQDAMSSFIENFYDEDEQAAYLKNAIDTAFDTIGLADAGYVIPQTNDEFRNLLETMDTTTEEGSYLYGQVLLLSEGFAQMNEAAEILLTTLTDAALYTQYVGSSTDFTARQIALDDNAEASAQYAITAAEMMLDAVKAETELYNLTMDNYSDQLTAAHLAGELTADQLANYESMGDALLNVAEAEKAYADLLAGLVEEIDVSAIQAAIKAISDAWLGNLSYLTLQQKAEYASGFLGIAQDSDGAIDTVAAARAAAETALKTTATKEEYIPIFQQYITELNKNIPEATLDTVVQKLDELIVISDDQSDNLRRLA